MKTKRNHKNCYWSDDCGLGGVCERCEQYDPLDNSNIKAEYDADLHMRVKEYRRHVNEMNGDA